MKSIAIIEDDVYIGDMLEEVLKEAGYEPMRAYSGTEALYLLSQKKPDLVLLDLMLPGLPGEDVIQHISGIPVIVLSAKGDVQDKIGRAGDRCIYVAFNRRGNTDDGAGGESSLHRWNQENIF